MAKARLGFYETKGDALARTHKSCPKCGPGIFLAEHEGRRSCGRCGYSESKAPVAKVEKPPKARPAKAPTPPAPATASAPTPAKTT